MVQSSEYLQHARLSSMGRDKDVFDVFRLRRGELSDGAAVSTETNERSVSHERMVRLLTFCFVAPLTDFSNELVMSCPCSAPSQRRRRLPFGPSAFTLNGSR